jgi:hypothetical protein
MHRASGFQLEPFTRPIDARSKSQQWHSSSGASASSSPTVDTSRKRASPPWMRASAETQADDVLAQIALELNHAPTRAPAAGPGSGG